jgi:hypothetical protein
MLLLRAIFLLSVTAICVIDTANAGPSTPPRSTEVWTGQLCTDATRDKDKVLLAADKLFEDAPAEKICIDRSLSRLDYKANSLRIETNKKIDFIGVRLTCVSDEKARQFYGENVHKQVGLVVGDKVLGVFTVEEPNMGFGWHEVFGRKQAKDECELIAHAWNVPVADCSKPCDATANGENRGICINDG